MPLSQEARRMFTVHTRCCSITRAVPAATSVVAGGAEHSPGVHTAIREAGPIVV